MSEPQFAKPCPFCGQKVLEITHKPFCSARCQQLDLGRWLNGDYAIPAEEMDAPDVYSGDDPTEDVH